MYLTYQFSQIIKCGAEFSDLAGYTSRLGQLMEALDMLSTEMENIAIDYPHEESLSMDSSIRLENVTFSTPAGELIVSGKQSSQRHTVNLEISDFLGMQTHFSFFVLL